MPLSEYLKMRGFVKGGSSEDPWLSSSKGSLYSTRMRILPKHVPLLLQPIPGILEVTKDACDARDRAIIRKKIPHTKLTSPGRKKETPELPAPHKKELEVTWGRFTKELHRARAHAMRIMINKVPIQPKINTDVRLTGEQPEVYGGVLNFSNNLRR